MSVIPSKLNKGDCVVLIAPGGAVQHGQIDNIKSALEKLDLNVTVSENASKDIGYLAGTDQEKLKDIHSAFANKNIKGIFCIRGGYGCARLLGNLDYNLIKNNPKVLVGMSDITSLSAAIFNKTGLVTYSGPMEWHFSHKEPEFASEGLKSVLFNDEKKINLDADTVVRTGSVEGLLIGGNLEILQTLIGTEYDFEYKDNILFFETVGCFKYVIDRVLQQFRYSNKLKSVKAIIVGQNSYRNNDQFGYSFEEILDNLTNNLDIPIIIGAKFGHMDHHLTLPIGQQVELIVNENEQVLNLI